MTLNNQTVRQILHTSLGGNRIRVVLSNVFGTAPLKIGVIGTGYDTFATVIVGASLDNFSTDQAIRNIFWGISDAVERLSENEKPGKISLILAETNQDRQKQIRKFIADENKKIEENAKTNGAKQFNRYNNVEVVLNEPEEGKPLARRTTRWQFAHPLF